MSKVGLQVVFLHETLGGKSYWYKLPNIDISFSNLPNVCHSLDMCFFYPATIKAYYFILVLNPTLKWKNNAYLKGELWFFSFNFCLWMWHGTKNMGRCHKTIPNYIWHTCMFVYTTILNLDYWIKIKVIVDWSGFKSLYIFTIYLHFDHWIGVQQFKMFT
jgi:hypothetical protein